MRLTPRFTQRSYTRIPEDESPTDENESEKAQLRIMYRILPISFFGSLGMASTNATTIFAYATLLCHDPHNCTLKEEERYSDILAISVTITNLCGFLVLGFLPLLARRYPKGPLYFWLGSRAASVAILALGVIRRSIWIAISGRVFEGLAKDNILQFALNTIFVQARQQSQIPHLLGISLALYMMGQALSPTISGIFTDFQISFVIAIGTLLLCEFYLYAFVHTSQLNALSESEDEGQSDNNSIGIRRLLWGLVEPLYAYFMEPILLIPGLATLFYFASVSYLYPIIMLFATVQFDFTGRENGWLISIAALSSSVYLFIVHYAFPRLRRRTQKGIPSTTETPIIDKGNSPMPHLLLAMVSMSLMMLIIPSITLTTRPWQLYPIIASASLGLSTPTFIRSYAVNLVADGTQVITVLTLMETFGAFLSPLFLGAAQSHLKAGMVFLIAAMTDAIGLLCLGVGMTVHVFFA